jgi:hypothetical protein
MSPAFCPVTLKSEEVVCERNRPVRGSRVRLHLSLSATPDAEWVEAFSLIWAQRIYYSRKCRTGVDGDLLWIECDPNELEEYHLDNLKATVTWTNQLCQQAIEAQRLSGKTTAEWSWLDHLSMDDLAGGLNRSP